MPPGLDTTHDTKQGYIDRLYDLAADNCLKLEGESLCPGGDQNTELIVHGHWLSPQQASVRYEPPTAEEFAEWRDAYIAAWHDLAAGRRQAPPEYTRPGQYLLLGESGQPGVHVSNNVHNNRRSPTVSPDTPPPPADSEDSAPDTPQWQDGGRSDGSTTSDDQYMQTPEGYFRRKAQPDGTHKCYFTGHDGSYVIYENC